MSRLTISTAIAWLLVIFLLWFMIRIDSENASWLRMGTVEPAAPATAEPAVQPESSALALTCEESENALRDRLDTARHCTMDSDCTLFDFGHPIDCMTSVAKTEITVLRLEYRRYEESCEFRVYFDCPAEPMERRAVCRENRCSVSLETTDILEDETLDFLGISDSRQK